MNLLSRLLRTTWQNIYRHGLSSIVAVSITALLFFLFNVLLFAGYCQAAALNVVNARLDLALNFTQSVSDTQAQSIIEDLKAAFPKIRNIKFVSSEVAFQRFLKNFSKSNQQLARWLQTHTRESPLPATLIISADAQYHNAILDFITTDRFISFFDLRDSQTGELASEAAEKVISLDATISRITFAATVLFGLLASLIITAIVRLTILSRYTEVTIMRLVGATKHFVQIPFILEGIIFGVVATVSSNFAFLIFVNNLDTSSLKGGIYGGFGELLQKAASHYISGFALTLGWQILAAILIGIVASLVATRKYLRRDLVF